MRVNILKGLITLLVTVEAHASAPAGEAQLPDWAVPKWSSFADKNKLRIHSNINPFLWRGDFDGDRVSDLAILVEATQSGKIGIVILPGGDKRIVLLGAGENFGNGGDNFNWLDTWTVKNKGRVESHLVPDGSLRLQGDALIIAKEGSASALVYFDRGSYKWLQVGD